MVILFFNTMDSFKKAQNYIRIANHKVIDLLHWL